MKVTNTKLTDVKIIEMDVLAIIVVLQKVIQKQNLLNTA